MRIEHVGLWVEDLEGMKTFYETFFNVTASELYHNPKTDFRSYFLSFTDGARLEIMTRPDIKHRVLGGEVLGFTHLAIALDSREEVDALVKRLVAAGRPLLNGPRVTGDGYYEAVVEDPEGNLLEITV